MIAILFTVLCTLVAGYAVWTYSLSPSLKKPARSDNNAMYFIGASAAAFLLRVILSAAFKGHDTDMNCFIGWSNAIFENGISKFYSLDMFHDYPPGYMYVLYFVGAVNKLFGFSDGMQYAVVKLPAVICDIISAYVIYRASKKKFSDAVSTIFASLYLFNPAAVLNCSLWGQVDSVYTLFAMLMIYFITEKKMIPSYFMFAICIFIKPQAFIFTPVLVGGIVLNVFRDNYSQKKFLKNLGFGIAAILMMLLMSLPFGIGSVVDQYRITLGSYPYLTVNAFNIWAAAGQNWGELSPMPTMLSYIMLAAIAVYSFLIILRSKNPAKYYIAGALLAFLTYMLSVKMHERYAFPAMALMLLAVVTTTDLKGYAVYFLLTISQLINTAWVLYIYNTDTGKYYRSAPVTVYSILNIAIMCFFVWYTYKMYFKDGITSQETTAAMTANKASVSASAKGGKKQVAVSEKKVTDEKEGFVSKKITLSAVFPKTTRFDVIAMIIITALYSGVALYDLGDMHAAETEYMLSDGEITIDFGQDHDVTKYTYFLGSWELGEERNIQMTARSSSGEETYSENITSGSVFHWNEKDITAKIRYLTLSTKGTELSIKEFALIGTDGEPIEPVSVSSPAADALFDEQYEVPERSTFRNGTYFDEIYHGRTAYEFVHSLHVYEWTHPPLGKVLIAIGVLLFGMCPFGWRIVGTVFGIIMVPIIYMFAKKLLKKSWLAVVTCILFTFDFMHFAQTRIATIDVYVTFFIMLMYYFMYKYYSTSFYDTPFRKGLGMLALSGTAMGFGIASKWTGIYAGAGLAVLFFITLHSRYNEYRAAVKAPKGSTNGIKHEFIIENFTPYMIKTLLWCVIFFIIVPLVIYCLSYIPYLKAPDAEGFSTIFQNQSSMLTYHSKTVLDSTHPFSSRWYEWIIMKRPIWYYSGKISDTVKEGISAFGNPLVWWLFIPAFFYTAYRAIKMRDKNALFLVISYLAQLVSWIPVTRLTFIYHYFPCVPFIVLTLGYTLLCIYNDSKNKKAAMYSIFGYAALVVVMFIMFYPVLSGHAVNVDYVKNFLKWFDSWVLI